MVSRTAKRNLLWPRSKLRPLRPKPGDEVTANMGVPRWAAFSPNAGGAYGRLRLMDAREPFLSGGSSSSDWPGPCTTLTSDFALIDLSKVTHSLTLPLSMQMNATLLESGARERCAR